MLPGDVLLVGSVSGINILPVQIGHWIAHETWLDCSLADRRRILKANFEPRHPSGKRLFEACDIVLDNCSNVGDTLVYDGRDRTEHYARRQASLHHTSIWALQARIVGDDA